jgi:hypothetical protein
MEQKPKIEYLVSACPNGNDRRDGAKQAAEYFFGNGEKLYKPHSQEHNSPDANDEYCHSCKIKLRKTKVWVCPNCNTSNSMSSGKCSGYVYYSWDDGGSTKCKYTSSSCFITTATIQSLGKQDDCYELNTFRTFRDTYLKQVAPNLIEQYYEIAPKIVEKIDKTEKSNQIYLHIWETYLLTCLSLIETKMNSEAMQHYQKMVHNLSAQYLNLTGDE